MDPKANKYSDFSPYAYCFNNPVYLIDPDGKDPIKRLVGTIDEAISYFRLRGFTSVEQIYDFYENPMDENNNKMRNFTRYVYTENSGWIDSILNGERPMDLLENAQCLAEQASCYSYEDLPSNAMGGRAVVWHTEFTTDEDGFTQSQSVLNTGEDLYVEVLRQFKAVEGATYPANAPNYTKFPDIERPKAPDVKESVLGIPLSWYTTTERNEMIRSGKYVPQNFSKKPMGLSNFPQPSEEFLFVY